MQKTIYTPAYRELIHRLRERRVKLGLSQRAVARSLRVQRCWVTRMEMCETRLDCVQTVRVCQVLGLSAPKLVRQLEGELSEGDDPPYVLAGWHVGGCAAKLSLAGDALPRLVG